MDPVRLHQTPVGVIEESGPTELLADHATEFIRVHLAVQPGERVAEPGCGTGVLSLFCALAGAGTVVGTDIDAVALQAARDNAQRNRVRNVEFRQGNLLDPVAGPLDLVVALLPHKPAPRPFNHRYFGGPDGSDLLLAVISQAAERLRPGGRLVLYVNSIANPQRVASVFSRQFSVRLLAEKRRPFSRDEFDELTPGMFAHLEAQRSRGLAEFAEDNHGLYFMARLFEGTRL